MKSKEQETIEALKKQISELETQLQNADELKFPWAGNLGRWEWHYPTGKVMYSPQKLEALGYTPGEINPLVYEWTAMIHPDDYEKAMDAMRRHLTGELPVYEIEYRIRCKNGGYKWFYDRGKVIECAKDNKPLRIAGIVFDISRSKEIEETLRRNLEFKNKMMAVISHDLRGPLGSVNHLLQMILDERLYEDPGEIRLMLEKMSVSSSTTYILLENLLQWARLNMDKVTARQEAVVLRQSLEEQLSLLEIMLNDKDLQIHQQIPANIILQADKMMTDTLFRNLLFNAAKFTPPGGDIFISHTRQQETLAVHIRDTGTGMPREVKEKIEGGDSPGSTRGTQGEKGLGIGLFLCREFLKNMNGSMKIESVPEKGSTFTIYLPLHPPEELEQRGK